MVDRINFIKIEPKEPCWYCGRRKMKETDAVIDDLVYKVYGITEAEKKTIEDSLK